jgi:hypothetical protein
MACAARTRDKMKRCLIRESAEDAIISERILNLYKSLSPDNSELKSLDLFLEACGIIQKETLNTFSPPGACQVH